MSLFAWFRAKSEIFGLPITIIYLISSVVTIIEAAYLHWGYMSANISNFILVAIAVFNFIVMSIFAYQCMIRKRELDGATHLLVDESARAKKETERADKLAIALKLQKGAYNKATNTDIQTLSCLANMDIVEQGSPEHLKNLSHNQADDFAKEIAKEAGIDL